MITRSQLPAEVQSLACWVHFSGTGSYVRDLMTKEQIFVPMIYGWQIPTRDTQFVYDHPVIKELKSLGFQSHGRKWNLCDENDLDCRNPDEPTRN